CGPYSCWGVNAAGNIVRRSVSLYHTNIVICLNGHKHVTFDLGRLYVICSDGSIMRCI
ncbi:hypothetical protein cypCar_00044041, partial [Cyprinus carpio]